MKGLEQATTISSQFPGPASALGAPDDPPRAEPSSAKSRSLVGWGPNRTGGATASGTRTRQSVVMGVVIGAIVALGIVRVRLASKLPSEARSPDAGQGAAPAPAAAAAGPAIPAAIGGPAPVVAAPITPPGPVGPLFPQATAASAPPAAIPAAPRLAAKGASRAASSPARSGPRTDVSPDAGPPDSVERSANGAPIIR